MLSTFSFPNKIVFGCGAVNSIFEIVSGFSINRALIVTDKGIVKAGLVEKVTDNLQKACVEYALFNEVSPNPTEDDVHAGVERYRSERCDFIIGIGGGSSLDVAKAIRLKATHNLPLAEYEAQLGGAEKMSPDMPDMIAVPTAAGTGSEVGRGAVITIKSTGRKTLIFGPYLIPNVAVVDPELTIGLPKTLTAYTGMDALTHNLESYLSTQYHPICDAIAIKGVQLAGAYLRRAVENGKDIEARTNMMMAAMMGAIAFQKDLGVAHSLAHPLSTIAGLHHGMANAIVLPHTMEFNFEYAKERLRDIAGALGVNVSGMFTSFKACPGSLSRKLVLERSEGSEAKEAQRRDAFGLRSLDDAAQASIVQIKQLGKDIGIPERLRDVGVSADMIPQLAEQAMEDGCHLTNPRKCQRKDMAYLYNKSL